MMKPLTALITAVFSALLCLMAGLGIVQLILQPQKQRYITVD